MRRSIFWLNYALLVVVQLLLSNFLRVSPYMMLTILPFMVLCISIRVGTVGAMFIAAATGLTVDFLTEGVIGLNTISLIPVAFCRNGIIRLVFFSKTLLALLIAQSLFLVIYIWVDSAGMRSLSFNAIRFGVSLVTGMLVSLFTLGILAPDPRR